MQQYSSNEVSNDAWVTTRVAAAALGVKPQKVRNYIANGELEAITEGEGTKRRYLVSISSLENLYAERYSEGEKCRAAPVDYLFLLFSGHESNFAISQLKRRATATPLVGT